MTLSYITSPSKSHLNQIEKLHTFTVTIVLTTVGYSGTVVLEMVTKLILIMSMAMAILLFGAWSPLCNISPEKILYMQGNPVVHQDTGHHQSPKYNCLHRQQMDADTDQMHYRVWLILFQVIRHNHNTDLAIPLCCTVTWAGPGS